MSAGNGNLAGEWENSKRIKAGLERAVQEVMVEVVGPITGQTREM